MNQPQFIITRVEVVGPYRLALNFADGFAGDVDLSGVIRKHPTLARLRDKKIFGRVTRDEWKRGVIFADDDALALASDNLRALALEQVGEYSHQQLTAWMYRHQLSLDAAAAALGISRRMLAYYRSGEKLIPKTVGLAMIGWVAQRNGFEYEAAA
jgi:hypothetical protein